MHAVRCQRSVVISYKYRHHILNAGTGSRLLTSRDSGSVFWASSLESGRETAHGRHVIYITFLPYTFFLLNGDMALNKNRPIFVHNLREKSQTQLQETDS